MISNRSSSWVLLIAGVLVGGCLMFIGCDMTEAFVEPDAHRTRPIGHDPEGAHVNCPIVVDTSVEVIDTRDGIALNFLTDGDENELRLRAHDTAERFRMCRSGPDAVVFVEAVQGGARVFVPTDASRLDALRAHFRTLD